jgi:hypothetical protein
MTEHGWITYLVLRQPVVLSHDVAHSNVLDVAQKLLAEGWDVTLRPTLPDESIREALDG